MIPVVICEDDKVWRQAIEKEIISYQMKSDWELELVCVEGRPEAVLCYIGEQTPRFGIYILDVELKAGVNGIQLGKEIRRRDAGAQLIFVTAAEKMLSLAFRMNLGVCNYIIKDKKEWRGRLQSTLLNLEGYYHAWSEEDAPMVSIEYKGVRETVCKRDIYYVEAIKGTHRIRIVLKNGERNCPGTLANMEHRLGDEFLLCRRGCLVNRAHIRTVDMPRNILVMDNGAEVVCSVRLCRRFKAILMK